MKIDFHTVQVQYFNVHSIVKEMLVCWSSNPSHMQWVKQLFFVLCEKAVTVNQSWCLGMKNKFMLLMQLFCNRESQAFIIICNTVLRNSEWYFFLHDNFVFLQQRYQREIDKLERENRELRKQVIILKGDSMPTPRKIKVLYSRMTFSFPQFQLSLCCYHLVHHHHH